MANSNTRFVNYKPAWELEFKWVSRCPTDQNRVLCKYCKSDFSIASCGRAQVVRHGKSKGHQDLEKILNNSTSQRTLHISSHSRNIFLSTYNNGK